MAEVDVNFLTANKIGTWEERRGNLFVLLQNMTGEERMRAMDKYYVDWLQNGFDEDYENNGYVGHLRLAEEIHARIPDTSKRILDCASGNGFLGEQVIALLRYHRKSGVVNARRESVIGIHNLREVSQLKKRGFTTLDALDMSQGSLDYSRKKNIYTNFFCAALGPNRLPIQDDEYDGIGLTGGFGAGHVQLDCLPELIRVTKPGGLIMFLVREAALIAEENFCNGAVDATLHKMAAEGSIEFLEKKRLLYIMQEINDKLVEYAYLFVLKAL